MQIIHFEKTLKYFNFIFDFDQTIISIFTPDYFSSFQSWNSKSDSNLENLNSELEYIPIILNSISAHSPALYENFQFNFFILLFQDIINQLMDLPKLFLLVLEKLIIFLAQFLLSFQFFLSLKIKQNR
jgi:hypothetical protein